MAKYIERTEELMLAMNAGARAIENTKRYHGAVYIKDLFSEDSREIPYLLAAKVLREVSDAPAADVAPVVHGRWIDAPLYGSKNCRCSECRRLISIQASWRGEIMQKYCPNCGAIMDGGAGNAGEEV